MSGRLPWRDPSGRARAAGRRAGAAGRRTQAAGRRAGRASRRAGRAGQGAPRRARTHRRFDQRPGARRAEKRGRERRPPRGGAASPHDRGRGQRTRPRARPGGRGRGGATCRQRPDDRDRGQRAAPAVRGDEGPDHRPRRSQCALLRVGHRRQRDHRRHSRGGVALLLRPGPARNRPAHPGDAWWPTGGSTRTASRTPTSTAAPRSTRLCLRAADDALAEVGIHDLDERLRPILGRLRYRTSYGQNVLGHLLETAHIAGLMAAELGLEPALVRLCS